MTAKADCLDEAVNLFVHHFENDATKNRLLDYLSSFVMQRRYPNTGVSEAVRLIDKLLGN